MLLCIYAAVSCCKSRCGLILNSDFCCLLAIVGVACPSTEKQLMHCIKLVLRFQYYLLVRLANNKRMYIIASRDYIAFNNIRNLYFSLCFTATQYTRTHKRALTHTTQGELSTICYYTRIREYNSHPVCIAHLHTPQDR